MIDSLKQEVEKFIKKLKLDCLVEEFKDKVDWSIISYHQKLSESFIREFKDKVDWFYISVHQKLSESFIREFKDKADWSIISYHQKLSFEFIYEFQDRLDMKYLFKNNKITEKQLKLVRQEINRIRYENLVGSSNDRPEILDL